MLQPEPPSLAPAFLRMKTFHYTFSGTSSSEDKLERVKALGLQHGINYKQRDYEEAIKELTRGEGVDAVFEMLGGEHTTRASAA